MMDVFCVSMEDACIEGTHLRTLRPLLASTKKTKRMTKQVLWDVYAVSLSTLACSCRSFKSSGKSSYALPNGRYSVTSLKS